MVNKKYTGLLYESQQGTGGGQEQNILDQNETRGSDRRRNPLFSFALSGAEGQNRTADTGIFSRIFVKTEKPEISTS